MEHPYMIAAKGNEGNALTSAAANIANAEKFVELFESWLYEEDNVKEQPPSVEEHIQKLQSACKELKKIELVIESLTTQHSYDMRYDSKSNMDSKRIQWLLERFEHIKTYVDLRQYMLKMFQRLFEIWLEQGKPLKIWLAETMALQERLHSTTCNSEAVIGHHLELQKVLIKESNLMEGKLEICKKMVCKLLEILKEIGSWSEKFRQVVDAKTCQNGTRRWNDVLIDSVTEEMDQVDQRFSAVTKLNYCYLLHLEDLLQMTLQGHRAIKSQRKITDIHQKFQLVFHEMSRKTAEMRRKKNEP
ncbi:microtubule-actin cross-linking factor 1-like [Ascaphus truei]|uniref:microtubule-actin cross-linking factor 1-like n=1 Tax=Ascaphus truei TaxID=8439 RepID=UPI003F5A7B1B